MLQTGNVPLAVLEQVVEEIPYVALGPAYKLVDGFEERFGRGVPSLVEATSAAVWIREPDGSADQSFGDIDPNTGAMRDRVLGFRRDQENSPR